MIYIFLEGWKILFFIFYVFAKIKPLIENNFFFRFLKSWLGHYFPGVKGKSFASISLRAVVLRGGMWLVGMCLFTKSSIIHLLKQFFVSLQPFVVVQWVLHLKCFFSLHYTEWKHRRVVQEVVCSALLPTQTSGQYV